MNPLIQAWLLQASVILLVLGAITGMLAGGLLIFKPERLRSLGLILNRWISTRRMDRSLERKISLDSWFYRHRKVTGTLIFCGAAFILYFFTIQLDREQTVLGLARRLAYPLPLAAALLDALVLTALLGALGALVASLFILFRPSLLRGFEQHANQWLSLRRSLKTLEIPRDDLERYVDRHTYQVGVFLLLGGAYTLVLLLLWLGR